MKQYKQMLQHILDHGKVRGDRTGTGTIGVFGYQNRYNLQEGFPIVSCKYVPFKLVVAELLWFLSGSTNNNDLAKLSGCEPDKTIWAKWATGTGDLGPIYGEQWRSWTGVVGEIDQISNLIDQIKNTPNSRRLIVSAWNPTVLPDEAVAPQVNVEYGNQALPPCHTMFQFHVQDGKLSCQLYQRSADAFLGVPFNIASYALLTCMIADQCDLEVGEFIHTFGDLHIYSNHMEQVQTILGREEREMPRLLMNPCVASLYDYTVDDFGLRGYNPWPAVKGEVAV